MIGSGGNSPEPAVEAPQTPDFDPGELAPFPASPFPALDLSEPEKLAVKELCDLVGNKDVAARRWEVEQTWEARLFNRGYQYLLPRKGGGWILPPFATDYQSASGRRRGDKWYGYETNIVATYGDIITAALTRDRPQVRFEPEDPMADADITAADEAVKYARLFERNNDLATFQEQLVYYLCTDGRAVIVVDHVLDAQRFGRIEANLQDPVVPETEAEVTPALLYLVRHGETDLNADGRARGRSEVDINDRGARQVQRSADWLKTKGIGSIISSPVRRSLDSAAILQQATGAQVTPDDRAASLDVGELAGEPSGAVADDIEDSGRDAPIGGDGESLDDFQARVRSLLSDMLSSQGNGPTALVTHDSVISQIFKELHGESVPPGSLIGPGGVAAVYPAGDGTYSVRSVFPYTQPAPASGQSRGFPRGMELVEPFGILEAKVPVNSLTLHDCPFVQISREYDVAYVKAMFPDYADKITPGQAGAGENELDRIARINTYLALEASYVTGDSMVRDCTVQRTWFRPGFLMEIKNKEVRKSLMSKCPDGMMVVYAGETQVLVRNENMEDHLSLVHAYPGSGQNRRALCTNLISVQKRLNNWVDLLNAYYVRTIPQRYIDSDIFDPNAIREQSSVPGAYIPFSGDKLAERPQQSAMQPIWVEPVPTHQPSMPDFIKLFSTDLPQLLCGALPSLFGSAANTDTVGGIAIQRDQALARLGTPWHSIQMATCRYFKQAVQLAARCRMEDPKGVIDGHAVRIDLADMRGNILTFPESDANFPESWNQKQQRYQQLLQDASNPLVAGILSNPANLKLARDMVGITEFAIPQAASYEKQLGELDRLLREDPIPNPEYAALAQHVQQMQAALSAALQHGLNDQQMQQQIDEAIQQLKGIPEELPSVAIDEDTDDHATEEQACLDTINSPLGRRLRNGTPEERLHFANLKLHMMAHRAAKEKMADKAKGMPKPMSLSANFKDLPPAAAAAALTETGLPADAPSVAAGRELNAQIKKSSKVAE